MELNLVTKAVLASLTASVLAILGATSAPAAPPTDPKVLEAAFVAVINQELPQTQDLSYEAVVKLGTDACKSIDEVEGNVLLAIVTAMSESPDAEDAAFLYGAAVYAFCPEYLDDLEKMAELGD